MGVFTVYKIKLYEVLSYCKEFHQNRSINVDSKGKGKAIPLQTWSGPEDSRKLRFPDYMTAAQDGGKVVSLTHRPPLPPEKAPGTHLLQAESTPGPWCDRKDFISKKNSSDTTWHRTRDLPICSTAP